MARGVFIIREPCHFDGVKRLEIHFLLIALIRDKYLLHNINEE
jgi:hypothetical protein